jgi:hypothetical protein
MDQSRGEWTIVMKVGFIGLQNWAVEDAELR